VRDTGIGISSEDQTKIFERYFQIKHNNQVSGSGIGLSLVKNLAEITSSDISVESKLNKGSSFKIRLKTHTPTITMHYTPNRRSA
jgi:signal transduction histidine kinase